MPMLSSAWHYLRACRRQSRAERNFRRFGMNRRAVGQVSLHEADQSTIPIMLARMCSTALTTIGTA